MPKVEKRVLEFIRRHVVVIAGVCLVIGSAIIRYFLRGILTGDMEVFLVPWMQALREGGISAGANTSNFDYNAAYLLLLYGTSFLPVTDMVAVKIVSIVFDYFAAAAMAWAAYTLLADSPNRRFATAGAFVGTLLLPIPLANGALWGQCDIIYTLFIVLCLVFLLKEKYLPAMLLFAVALCFKLQAIFFLPVLVILYFSKRCFSILHFLYGPVLLVLLGLFIRSPGDSFFKGLLVYANQTQAYPRLYADYPNLYYTLRYQPYDIIGPAGIVFAFVVLGAIFLYVVHKNLDLSGDRLVLLSVWIILTVCHTMPSMHDRYAFTAELLIWLFYIVKPSVERFAVAFAVNFIPVFVYIRVFFEVSPFTQNQLGVINVLVYVAFSVYTIVYLRKSTAALQRPGPNTPIKE